MKRLFVLIVVLVVAALGTGMAQAGASSGVFLDVNSPAFLNNSQSVDVSGDISCRPRQQAGARLQIKQNTGVSFSVDVGQCVPGGTFWATVFPRGTGTFHTGPAQATLILRTGDGSQVTHQEVIQIVD